MTNLAYLLALHSTNGLGPVRLKRILEYFKDPKTAWEANLKEFKNLGIPENIIHLFETTRKNLDPQNYWNEVTKSGIKILTIFDDNYPKLLAQIYDPPILLYYQGEILPKDGHALAVVGTRKITGYGKTVTEQLTEELVNSGFTIVSGLARGVDTVAHQTAIKLQGRTLAILGGGLNQIFPPENANLVRQIASEHGAVISEYPPDYPALAGNFPSRNRIISGLSKAVLVTEAAQDSGSLITARLANEIGREVFAVPGPITSSLSIGTSSLIKEGAKLVTRVEDILEEMGIEKVQKSEFKIQNEINLSDAEREILRSLENEQKHIDELCRETKLQSSEVSGVLIKMEIAGIVRNLGGGVYIRI